MVASEQYRPSPLVAVFDFGYEEIERQVKARGTVTNKIALERSLQLGVSEEIAKLERNMDKLATTASVTPFIGLLGTVLGIIQAFQGLGQQGATSLRTLGPGISEALISTAIGLIAAIPGGHFLQPFRPEDPRTRRAHGRFFHGVSEPGGTQLRGMMRMAISVNGGNGYGSRRRRGGPGSLAEINVTPFVDVVLVLLIIFMLTAHVMEFGIEVDVPKVAAGQGHRQGNAGSHHDQERRHHPQRQNRSTITNWAPRFTNSSPPRPVCMSARIRKPSGTA